MVRRLLAFVILLAVFAVVGLIGLVYQIVRDHLRDHG